MNRLLLIAAIFLGSCVGSESNETTDESKSTATETPQTDDKIVGASENYFSRKVDRKAEWVLGKSYKTKPEALITLYIATSRLVSDAVTQNKWVMTGSIMAIYDEIPRPHQEMQIFVGVPVSQKGSVPGLEWKELKGGTYVKATTNFGIGESAQVWENVMNDIKKKGNQIGFPVYEYPSDSRNREMTTEVSQCNLLFPLIN